MPCTYSFTIRYGDCLGQHRAHHHHPGPAAPGSGAAGADEDTHRAIDVSTAHGEHHSPNSCGVYTIQMLRRYCVCVYCVYRYCVCVQILCLCVHNTDAAHIKRHARMCRTMVDERRTSRAVRERTCAGDMRTCAMIRAGPVRPPRFAGPSKGP